MRLSRIALIAAIGTASLLLSACSQKPGTIYGASIDKVYDALKADPIPLNKSGKSVVYADGDLGNDPAHTRTVVWDAAGFGNIHAILTAEGDNATRVEIVAVKAPGSRTDFGSREIMGKPTAEEFVDAKLSGRPFNQKNVDDAVAGYVLAHMGDIQEQGIRSAMEERNPTQRSAQDTNAETQRRMAQMEGQLQHTAEGRAQISEMHQAEFQARAAQGQEINGAPMMDTGGQSQSSYNNRSGSGQ